jgi:hypothetical protein
MFVNRKCSRSHFLSFYERQNMRKVYTVGGKRMWCSVLYLQKHTALPVIQFSEWDISIHASLVLCIFFGTGLEVLTVVRIHNVV